MIQQQRAHSSAAIVAALSLSLQPFGSTIAAGKRLVKPLVDEARQHETRMLRPLGVAEKAALRKLLEKLTQRA